MFQGYFLSNILFNLLFLLKYFGKGATQIKLSSLFMSFITPNCPMKLLYWLNILLTVQLLKVIIVCFLYYYYYYVLRNLHLLARTHPWLFVKNSLYGGKTRYSGQWPSLNSCMTILNCTDSWWSAGLSRMTLMKTIGGNVLDSTVCPTSRPPDVCRPFKIKDKDWRTYEDMTSWRLTP